MLLQLEKEDTKISWRDCDSWRDGERVEPGGQAVMGPSEAWGADIAGSADSSIPVGMKSAEGHRGALR